MNRKQKIKLAAVISVIACLSLATGLVLYALKQNINLFYTPSQLAAMPLNAQQQLRVGGYVKKASVQYATSGSQVRFIIMDPGSELTVQFAGLLPNLFREGQGVVVTGRRTSAKTLVASEVLAKHDEKYVPRYLVTELEKVQRRAN